MPELPEVETIRRQLEPQLRGREIRELEILDPRWSRPLPPEQVAGAVEGRRISALGRRGKYLLLRLDGGRILVTIEDDGRGFHPGQEKGMGILGMEERVRNLGGKLEIESKPGAALDTSMVGAIMQQIAPITTPWYRYFLSYDPRPALSHSAEGAAGCALRRRFPRRAPARVPSLRRFAPR